jgi:hypothetical protein
LDTNSIAEITDNERAQIESFFSGLGTEVSRRAAWGWQIAASRARVASLAVDHNWVENRVDSASWLMQVILSLLEVAWIIETLRAQPDTSLFA